MSNVPQKVRDILIELGFDGSDYWSLPQNQSVTILTHRALERIAAHKGVVLDPPQIIEADGANKLATVLVVGHYDGKTEWSFGEAAPQNNKNAYPWAMAEKRAKDRVILKLVGLHGDVYSSVDDFEADQRQNDQAPKPKPQQNNQAPKPKPQQNATAIPQPVEQLETAAAISQTQIQYINGELDDYGITAERFKSKVGCTVEDLPVGRYEHVKTWIKKHPKREVEVAS